MTRRDDAIEAAAREIDPGAWTGSTAVKGARRAFALEQATVILDAALAVLQPVIDNTAEALDALPAGTVLGAVGTHNAPCTLTIMDNTNPTEAADFWTFCGVTTWTVLWWGDKEPA